MTLCHTLLSLCDFLEMPIVFNFFFVSLYVSHIVLNSRTWEFLFFHHAQNSFKCYEHLNFSSCAAGTGSDVEALLSLGG